MTFSGLQDSCSEQHCVMTSMPQMGNNRQGSLWVWKNRLTLYRTQAVP